VYHFRTPLEVGLEIMEYLRGRLSGLGIPTFAVDLLGGFGKVPVLPNYIIEKNEDYIVFRNYENKTVKVKI
jgi:lysine 2,3-aminomutase